MSIGNESAVRDVNVSELIKRVNRALMGKDDEELLMVRVKLVKLRDVLAAGHREPVLRMIRAVDAKLTR